jgi:hypothetical protein
LNNMPLGVLLIAATGVGILTLARRRGIRRNAEGKCSRCGAPFGATDTFYLEGLRICVACAPRVRRSLYLGLAFLGFAILAGGLAFVAGVSSDIRHGAIYTLADWAHVAGMAACVLVGLPVLVRMVVRDMQAKNRVVKQRDLGHLDPGA